MNLKRYGPLKNKLFQEVTVHIRGDGSTNAKRLTAIARCLTAYQQGLLALKRLRQTGNQRITAPYVNVSHGSQAAVGDVIKASGQK